MFPDDGCRERATVLLAECPGYGPGMRLRPAVLTSTVVLALALVGCGGGDDGGSTDTTPRGDQAGLSSPIAAIQDDRVLHDPPAGQDRAAFLDERMAYMASFGGSVTRVDLLWSLVAPSRPENPDDPNDPAYDWSRYDAIVDAANRHDIEVEFTVWSTPDWAADPTIPVTLAGDPPGGAWGNRRPASAEDFGRFGAAAAKRYSDKGVHMWEAWNESNANFYLRPQYEKQDDRWVAIGPRTYAAMLDEFRDRVKDVDPDARIAGGVMAPRGDRCGLSCDGSEKEPNRLSPQAFLKGLDEAGRPEMDAVAHHPYPSGKPTPKGSETTIDLTNFSDLFTAIDATYLRGKPVWATEYGWQTKPSDVLAFSVTPREQAENIAAAFVTLRSDPRVEMGTYYFVQDNGQFNTGLRDEAGATKPGASAHALPMQAAPTTVAPRAAVTVIGQVRPTAKETEVTLEWRAVDGDRWRTLQTVPTGADGTFQVVLHPTESVVIRPRWRGPARDGRTVQWTGVEVPLTVG